uniref:Regulator of microtubule dynamics protein 1 n=1 Tax=Trichobilharzia regenti TaxID=157069 RepID=A0AA85IWC0_TRIRE|nr:unnamed protein product [Trichobilharzia regenti]
MSAAAKEVDAFLEKAAFVESYKCLEEGLKSNSNDAELLWRKARACFMSVYYVPAKPASDVCAKYFKDGMDAAKKAIDIEPNNANALTWYGIMMDELSGLKGMEERFKNVSTLYDLWAKSQKHDPNNFITESSLGMWHFIMTELHKFKPELFKGTKYTGNEFSYQRALDHMLKCESLAPGRSLITLGYLAKCYARLGNVEKAKEIGQKVLSHPAQHVEAQEAKKAVEQLMKELAK